MTQLGDIRTHYWMTAGMARAVGVDLAEARHSGVLSDQGYAALVTSCRSCCYMEECRAWLGTAGDGGAVVPEGCANACVWARLAIWSGAVNAVSDPD